MGTYRQLPAVDGERIFNEKAGQYLTQVTTRFAVVQPALIEQVRRAVAKHYHEHWRVYHATPHPAGMLLEGEEILDAPGAADFAVDRHALMMMIIFHDVIMKLLQQHGWNEKESARYAFNVLQNLGLPTSFCHLVAIGIRCTIDHRLPTNIELDQPAQNTIALLLDLDLSGVGETAAVFQQNTEALWREQESVTVQRSTFDAGTATWAERLLDREYIYHTPFFVAKEARARTNLRGLIS